MEKKQLNVRVSEETHKLLELIIRHFSNGLQKVDKSTVVEVAIREFYANYVNGK